MGFIEIFCIWKRSYATRNITHNGLKVYEGLIRPINANPLLIQQCFYFFYIHFKFSLALISTQMQMEFYVYFHRQISIHIPMGLSDSGNRNNLEAIYYNDGACYTHVTDTCELDEHTQSDDHNLC